MLRTDVKPGESVPSGIGRIGGGHQHHLGHNSRCGHLKWAQRSTDLSSSTFCSITYLNRNPYALRGLSCITEVLGCNAAHLCWPRQQICPCGLVMR